ncbi:MAG: histidine kinase [Chthoniobacteraceae bacterium]|nr:histidine kinase [Chthoniobacteraceae bacterium]
MAGIGWAEYTSWKEIAELQRQLHSPALVRILAQSAQWPVEDHQALQSLLAEAQTSLGAFRGWLLVSCISLLVLVVVLAYSIQRWMIAPLESQLVKSHAVIARQEKLASLGVLAAGVAHEIRNPLTALKARIFSQTKRLQRHSPEHADALFINAEIDRLEQIVKDFLQFARPGEPGLAPVKAADFLHGLCEQMTADLEPCGIDLRLETPENLWLKMDAGQIKQVMINLIRNAAESIGRNGSITLRARATVLPFAPWRLPAIALEVEDTGAGIPAEVQGRLFDPFFTTKEAGTGLGLAIAERIVQRHGGALQFRTQIQRGTIFSVLLPAAQDDEFSR